MIVGALSFCCLGYALASVIRNDDVAQPVTQAVMLPLYFISGVFIASSGADLLTVAALGLGGLLIALRRFSRLPRGG